MRLPRHFVPRNDKLIAAFATLIATESMATSTRE